MTGVPWSHLCAVILAAGIAAAIVILAVQALRSNGAITPELAELLALVIGSAIGAEAAYLGMSARGSESEPKRREPPPTP